jgi:hypothetical protein
MHLNRKKVSNNKNFILNKKKYIKQKIDIPDTSIPKNIPINNSSIEGDISDKTKKRIKDENILVSIVGSSIRPQYWMNFYNNIKQNNSTPFEIIFCGDAEFDFELPVNFTYIYSKVKPVQCMEIARRAAFGKFIFFSPDDLVFSKFCIDHLIETYFEKHLNPYDIVSTQYHFRYMSKDINSKFSVVQLFWSKTQLIKYKKMIVDMPYFPINIFALSSSLNEIGGIDQRFIAQASELDMAMRMYEMGGKLYYNSHSFIMKEHKSNVSLDKSNQHGYKGEVQKIFKFWCKKSDQKDIDPKLFYTSKLNNMIISKKRLIPFIPFENKDILYKNQGESGKWGIV